MISFDKDGRAVVHVRLHGEDNKLTAFGGVTVIIQKHKHAISVRLSVCDIEDNYDKKFGVWRAINKPDYAVTTSLVGEVCGISRLTLRHFRDGVLFGEFLRDIFGPKVENEILEKLLKQRKGKNSVEKQLGKAQQKIKQLEERLERYTIDKAIVAMELERVLRECINEYCGSKLK